MANNSALKLVVDTSEYDANIKKAAEGIQHLAKRVHDAGGFFDYFDKATMDFVKGLEDMSTAAVTSAGQYRELENAYKGLAATYNGLDPFEKQGEAGRELANQLGILKDRVLEAKANFEDASKSLEMPKIESTKSQLRDLTKELTDITVAYRALSDEERQSPIGQEMAQKIQQMTEKAGIMRDAMDDVQASIKNSASDTRVFDQLAGGATILTSSLQTAQGAARLFGVDMGDSVKVLADLQAAMAVTSGLQQLQNLLQKQSALMQGVNALQKEFNLLAAANPYALLATAVAAVAGAYMLYQKNASEAEKAQKSLNAELDNTQNQLAQIDKDTDFSVGIAEAAGKSWKAIHELRLEAARTKLQLADMNYDKLADSGNASAEQMKQAADMQQKAWDNVMKVLNEGTIHDVQMRNGKGKRGGKGSKGTTVEQTEEQMNNSQIEKLTNEYIKATDERRQAIEKEIATLQNRNEEIQKLKDMAKGKAFTAGELGEVTVTGSKMAKVNKDFRENGASEAGLSSYIGSLKSAISQEDLGSEVFNNLTSKLQDASMFQSVLTQAIAGGASAADLSGVAQEIKQKLLEGDIDESAWQEFLDKINELIQNADLKLTFDVDTKSVTTAVKQQKKETAEMAKEWQAAGSAIQAVGSAMSQIEDPAAKVLGIIAQAVATMALSYSQAAASPAVTGSGWGWIAFAATGLATMISSINGIKQATEGFANGGVIPGNSMSGDNLRGMTPDGTIYGLNSQEIILNRAQQGNLASQLEGGGIGNLHLDTVISGEDIRLVLNNNGRRTGRGEYVQSRNSRG